MEINYTGVYPSVLDAGRDGNMLPQEIENKIIAKKAKQIVMFEDDEIHELYPKVNQWLWDNYDKKIIDIKFSQVEFGYKGNKRIFSSVMVVFQNTS